MDLRPQAIGSGNRLFAGGHDDDANTDIAYTLVQTAKLCGLDALAYLTWVQCRVAQCRVAQCRDGGEALQEPHPRGVPGSAAA